MTIYNNEMMTTNAEGKIFNPVTKRHIKDNTINRNSIKSQIERHNLKVLPLGTFKLIVFFMDGFKYEGLFTEKNIFCCDVVNRIREARTEDDTTDYKFFLEGDEDELTKFDIDESNNYFGMPFRCEPVIQFKVGRFRVTHRFLNTSQSYIMEILRMTKHFLIIKSYEYQDEETMIKIHETHNSRRTINYYVNCPNTNRLIFSHNLEPI